MEFVSGTTYNGSASREIRIKAGSITSAMIQNGTITNEDISASADIEVSKLEATTADNGKVLTVVSGVPTWSTRTTSGTFSYEDVAATSDLSSYTGPVLRINQNITALPVGTNGQMLVLVNTTGGTKTVSSSNLYGTHSIDGRRALVMYWATDGGNGRWYVVQ